jgi:hypothetical protein
VRRNSSPLFTDGYRTSNPVKSAYEVYGLVEPLDGVRIDLIVPYPDFLLFNSSRRKITVASQYAATSISEISSLLSSIYTNI